MNKPLRLSYDLSGPENLPVVLFLHGFLGNGKEWEEIVSFLADGFRCLTVDLPGHGKTAPLNRELDWSMENTAAAVIDVLNELAIKKCSLAGYSMGGRLALYLALHYPQRFSKVVMESASPGLKTAAARQERIARDNRLADQLESGDFKRFLTEWYNQPLFRDLQNHPRFREIFEKRLKNDPAGLAKSLREMGTGRQPSLWEKLPQNKIPLLLVVGEKDAKFRSIADETASLCSAATVKVIQGCGHNVHFEKPEIFAAEVITFLYA